MGKDDKQQSVKGKCAKCKKKRVLVERSDYCIPCYAFESGRIGDSLVRLKELSDKATK